MPIFVPLIWDFNAVDFVLLKNGNISIFQFILQKICASHGVPININVQGKGGVKVRIKPILLELRS